MAEYVIGVPALAPWTSELMAEGDTRYYRVHGNHGQQLVAEMVTAPNLPLVLAAPELRDALMAVTPPNRAPWCWCPIGWDMGADSGRSEQYLHHAPACRMARAALAKAGVT